MCDSHQPGSVTRFHMAIVAIMVLLLLATAIITGTCSISSEGNLLRHTAAPHTISQMTMPGTCADPTCPMHHHHAPASSAPCAHCATPASTAPLPAALAAPHLTTLAVVDLPGQPALLPPSTNAAPAPRPPLLVPRTARPASLRV